MTIYVVCSKTSLLTQSEVSSGGLLALPSGTNGGDSNGVQNPFLQPVNDRLEHEVDVIVRV